jgi:hypothetical protein
MLLSTAVNPDEGEAYGATVYGMYCCIMTLQQLTILSGLYEQYHTKPAVAYWYHTLVLN